jgi:hypothetical protein
MTHGQRWQLAWVSYLLLLWSFILEIQVRVSHSIEDNIRLTPLTIAPLTQTTRIAMFYLLAQCFYAVIWYVFSLHEYRRRAKSNPQVLPSFYLSIRHPHQSPGSSEADSPRNLDGFYPHLGRPLCASLLGL